MARPKESRSAGARDWLMVKVFDDLRSEWRRRGLFGVLLSLSGSERLPSTVFLLTETEIVRLEQLSRKALERTPQGYDWQPVGTESIAGLVECSPAAERNLLIRMFEKFFADGASCYAARHNGEIAAYVWAFPRHYVLTYDNYKGRNLNIRVDDGAVFLGNGMIGAKHRLRGLFPHLIAFVRSQWPPGMRFFGAIDSSNTLSLRSHYRLGFRPYKWVLCFTLFGRTWYFKRYPDNPHWRRQNATVELTTMAPVLASVGAPNAKSPPDPVG